MPDRLSKHTNQTALTGRHARTPTGCRITCRCKEKSVVSARSGQHGVTRALPPRCHCQTLLWALMVVQGYCVSEKVDVPIARGLTTAMVTNPICRIRRWWEKGVDSSERVAGCHERPRGSVGVRSPSPDPTWCSRGKFLSIEPSKGERYSLWPRRVLSLGRHHCAICKVGARGRQDTHTAPLGRGLPILRRIQSHVGPSKAV